MAARRSVLAGLAAAGWVAGAGGRVRAHDGALARPRGPVVLTVTGRLRRSNLPGGAALDLAMLEQMGREEIRTTTIWTEGVQVFTGVPLAALLECLGAEGRLLRAWAVNDYLAEMPMADARAPGPLIAYALNGEPMSVRDKGPLWLVFPYDAHVRWQSEEIYARSVWQLARIELSD